MTIHINLLKIVILQYRTIEHQKLGGHNFGAFGN